MKIKRLFMAFLALLIMFIVSGCQLAIEDKGEVKSKDRLVGVFITFEYLDLFDMEGYLNDNINKLSGGGFINMDQNNSKYQNRLYATLAARTLTNGEGDTINTSEYVFEGVEGISYFAARVPATDNEDSFITSGSDISISDGHMGIFNRDEEEKITLEGTIYISSTYTNRSFYINPVYQSSDGSVYATTGSGVMLGGHQGEGSVFSQTLDETTTVTENGKTKSLSTSIKISITAMPSPEKINVLQMDKDNKILSRLNYLPGELPDTISPIEKAEYIMVESQGTDMEGKTVTSRTLYDRRVQALDTFYCLDNGICVKQWTKLDWNKK